MRLYIAGSADTLQALAVRCNAEIEELVALNPHIADPSALIEGQTVKLPQREAVRDQSLATVPACTFQIFDPHSREQWIPLTSLEEMQRRTYDVLIVGTGAGGGAVLSRLVQQLAASGARIGVIERGGLLIPTHAQNIETMDQNRLFNYYASSAHFFGDYLSGQIYALGGRTLFWTLTSPRMSASEIVQWPVPLEAMRDYYTLAEQALNVNINFTKDAPLSQILLNRLQHGGYPDAAFEPLAMNLAPSGRFGVMNSSPAVSSIHFLAQALNRPFDLAIHSRAVKVLAEGEHCVGVEVISPNKERYVLRAKNTVLCAGTFGSAQILLNSGIGGKAVGRYLINHSRVAGFGRVSREEFPEVLGPLRLLVPGQTNRPYQIQIVGPGNFAWSQYAQQPLQEEWNILLATLGVVEARYDNYVSLDLFRRDEDGVPELNIHFSYSERDEEVYRLMADGVVKAAAAMDVPLVSQKGPAVCRLPVGSDIHEMGTCRMGTDPETSVTDGVGRVHDVQGLYVADNSVIPTSGTANPTLTTVALAFRTADAIAKSLHE